MTGLLRRVLGAVVLVVLVSTGAACTADAPASRPTPTTEATPTAPEYEVSGTVIIRDGVVHVCSGVRTSLPPQCGAGVEVAGWSEDVPDDVKMEHASGVSWGDATLTGTYDEGVLTLTRAPEPPRIAWVPPFEPPPAGTWDESARAALVKEIFTSGRWSGLLLGGPDPFQPWVNVLVPLDADGALQAEFDAEYGEGAVHVDSWLRPAVRRISATAAVQDELPVIPETLTCGANSTLPVEVETAALRDLRPASTLGVEGRAAITRTDLGPNAVGMAFAEVPDDWFVVEESPERIVLLQPFVAEGNPFFFDAPQFTMRLFVLGTEPPADPSTWFPAFENTCTFALPLDGLSVPSVGLDPGSPRMPDDTHLDLVVGERECTSGASVRDRIVLVGVHESEDAIDLVLGVEPLRGLDVAACIGVAPDRVRIELDAPVGERVVRNAGVVPAEPLADGAWPRTD